ncbi:MULTISPECIES: response regulator transcription factor [Chitinophagaceae]|uniref:response regulator transcription factor n=1 Tax=Chitinophagaceae TaxID=563835 RepID=UPI000DEEF688|nr:MULTISPECIES: response regulator transcription factor [Chitinophagaceae]RPD43612.1 DNA-binding response regulator [Paracnuella aquatica]
MNKTTPLRLVLADDHELFRDGLQVMLKKQPTIETIGEASNGVELLYLVRTLHPDVVITDIKMPQMDGIEATRQLVKEFPKLPVIALSMFDEENLIVDMLEAGARGYLLKNASKQEIVAAIETVVDGEVYYCGNTSRKLAKLIATSKFDPRNHAKEPEFSAREVEIIQMICEELSNKEIAARLGLSVRTVEGHRERIQEKMNVRNMAGIVVYAIKHHLYKV